ncbi:hypothetical protein GR183_11765 [Stappia sp. GBMRC 2046]|uniref:Gfo/Idh/MocA-like oxidoreductase N-terminal domain-containing protein n=1 Tax=Stappia sediminis TaxID=2692190 RepID=A0A7X3S8B2_9HYPH|nr:Gfo/Idh/MocA family oxidoreductase [Stappia sediminis]MXN65580.1 hypothetical protein [Stappia sediminis]
MEKVALIGCGNIGRRHLQALAAANRPMQIFIQEPDLDARDAAVELITGVRRLEFEFMNSAREVSEASDGSLDLAIIATGANVRKVALAQLLDSVRPRTVLLEKVLLTSERDLQEVGHILSDLGVNAYVNCGRRGFPGYRQLKSELFGMKCTSFSVKGAGWGLCSNAVHFIDLAEYLFEEELTALSGKALDFGSFPAKRPGCIEISGRLTGKLESGGMISLECLSGQFQPIFIEVACGNLVWIIDEANREIKTLADGEVVRSRPFESRNVSEMSHLYVELLEGRSVLPDYNTSARQHGFLLRVIKAHLNLPEGESTHCPIS